MNREFLSKWRHADALSPRRMGALRNEMWFCYAAVGMTLISIAAFLVHAGVEGPERYGAAGWPALTEFVFGKGLLGFFLFSGLVYQLTRAFFEQLPAMARDHGEAALIDPEQAPAAPIPLHAGAARYYREREVLR